MLESKRLRHFLAAYQLGSIGQAADKLLLSQPALSKSLRQLEDELGVRLFDRTPLGVVPTVFGEALAVHAKAIDSGLRNAGEAILRLRGGAKGKVRVGIGPSVAPRLLPLATVSLHALHPEIELTVTEGLIEDLIPRLRRNELDLAVGAWTHAPDPALRVETLLVDRTGVFAAVDHPLAGHTVSLPDLLAHTWALPLENQKLRQEFDALFTAQGLDPPQPITTSNSVGYLKALMRTGKYLSFLPAQVVGDPADAGLAMIELDVETMRPAITLTTRERAAASPLIAELVQVLRAVAEELGTA